MKRALLLAAACLLAFPAAAQLSRVPRPPEPPSVLDPAQNEHFRTLALGLERKAAAHDPDLAALMVECPRMEKQDSRAAGCQGKRDALAARLKPYFAELRAYREEARARLQALVVQLDAELASAQNAIRNIGFGATAAAYEQWEDLSEDAKDEMTGEAVGALLSVAGSPEFTAAAGAKLGAAFDTLVSKKLTAPTSWNPWNVNAQIREMERLGVDNAHFHTLMRKVAAAKDKQEYVESATTLMKYGSQMYKDGKAVYKVVDADGWRRRNWAITSALLTVLSDQKIIRPERAVRWLATQAGRKTLGGMKAALSASNVAMHLDLYLNIAVELENISGLPEQQLKTLERLDDRLKAIVERRKAAKKELARFTAA